LPKPMLIAQQTGLERRPLGTRYAGAREKRRVSASAANYNRFGGLV
jgi:hypothetical protein